MSSPIVLMVASTPSPLMEFAGSGKVLDIAKTEVHLTNHARTNIPWIRKDLRRDQDEVEKAKVKAKVKAKPKAKARARAKEKERKAKAKANVARVTLPQHSLKRKSGQRNSGRNGKPDLLLSTDIPTTDQRFSRSKKENGVKITPRPENAKVAT